MAVPGISPTLISNVFLTHPVSGVEPLRGERSGLTSNDLFLIGFLFFLNQIHQSILDSWEKFQENQSDVRDQKETGERNRELRTQEIRIQQEEATLIEGKRRQIEARNIETEGDVPLHAGRPHKAKRRFHESIYVDGGYTDPSSRQLNLPV